MPAGSRFSALKKVRHATEYKNALSQGLRALSVTHVQILELIANAKHYAVSVCVLE